MELGVYAFAWIMAISTLFLGVLDVNTNATTKEHMFDSIRSANQNALYDVQNDYEGGKTLSSPEMIETWLSEFAQDMDMNFEDLVVNFIQLEGEPPVYLMYVEGYKDKYAIINKDVYISYINGSTIIQSEDAEGEEAGGEETGGEETTTGTESVILEYRGGAMPDFGPVVTEEIFLLPLFDEEEIEIGGAEPHD